MLKHKMFKRYYPLKSVSDIFHMSQEDRTVLVKWLHRTKTDIDVYNMTSYRNALKNRAYYYRQIELSYDKDIFSLADKIQRLTDQYCELDEKDIDFLNDVLYRHKYIGIISMYCFPTRKNKGVI